MFRIILLGLLTTALLASEAPVQYQLTLTDPATDRFEVELVPAPIESDEAVFQMATSAPGTYQVHDWGRFVVELQALDADGNALSVTRDGDNRWQIADATRLARVSYVVDDTFDADHGGKPIWPMAGTNVEDDNIVINPFGIFGYISGQEGLAMDVGIRMPDEWGLATVLPITHGDDGVYRVHADNYHHLADSPMLGGNVISHSVQIDDCEVIIAVNGNTTAYSKEALIDTFVPVVEAARDWLGGIPTDRYAFLLHVRPGMTFMVGALEHRQSSLYHLPPQLDSRMLQTVGTHEFFHVVTPLNVHSEVIASFDYAKPRAPSHLWLYEGVTEYAAHMILRRANLTTDQRLLRNLRQKFIADAMMHDKGISLIELSEGTLDKTNHLYLNVYERGALTALALDLELLRLSDGTYGLRQLIHDLIERFGPERPFAKDELFTVLEELSGQPMAAWCERYIAGPERPDYTALLETVGWSYQPMVKGERGVEIHVLEELDEPTPAQLARRAAWLGLPLPAEE